MKHTGVLITLAFFTAVGVASVACAEPPPATLSDKNNDSDSTDPPETSSSPSATASATATATATAPLTTSTAPLPSTTSTAPGIPTNCATTTSALACGACCAQQNNPLAGCACNVGSQCAQACGANLCTGGMPDIGCGMCLLQSQCIQNLSSLLGQGGTAGGGALGTIQACVQQNACMSKGGAGIPGLGTGGTGGFQLPAGFQLPPGFQIPGIGGDPNSDNP